jgi:hypothetical protein
MDLFMLIKNYKLLSIIHLEKMNNYLANDFPSMNNIYDSTYYTKTKNYEQGLSDEYYKKAQMPFKTGVIPHYLTSDDYNVESKMIKSLSGNNIPLTDFKHGNMQPFLTKGVTQNTENLNGLNKNMGYSSGDVFIKKKEVEKFFDPQANVYNQLKDTNFILERTAKSKIQNNFNPIQSVKVGPGLNKGYTSEGSGGFQQADTNLYVLPKTREQLRIVTDERSSIFNLPMKPKNGTEQRGMLGEVNKNLPEKAFQQTEDNWFKGVSYLKKETERPVENMKDTSRVDTHIEYTGTVKYQDYYSSQKDDYGKSTIIVYDNERNLTQVETPVANFSSVIKAMIAPVTDALKISFKEYFVDNPRLNGNAAPQIPEKATLYDPVNHVMKTTVKETTIHETDVLNLTGAEESYSALYDTAKTTVKETTIHETDGGVLTGAEETYSALYDTAKTTVKETTLNEGNGGVLTGAEETYSALYDTTKTTVKETTIHETDVLNLSGQDETYSALYDTAKTTVKETTVHETQGGFIQGKDKGYTKNNNKANTTLRETLPAQDTQRNINSVTYYSTYVYDPSIVAKTTVKETTVRTGSTALGFLGGMLNGLLGGYLVSKPEAKNTQKQSTIPEAYGVIGSSATSLKQSSRESAYNVQIDNGRELINLKSEHTPGAGGKYVGLPVEAVNMSISKQIDLVENKYTPNANASMANHYVPIKSNNITQTPFKPNDANNNRLDGTILSSLIENPNIIKINPIIAN